MRVAAVLIVVLATLGCGSTPTVSPSPTARHSSAEERKAAIYSAVIRQLVKKDNTFGSAPSPFKAVYILDRPSKGAADPDAEVAGASSREPFSEELKSAVRARLADLPPVRFVRTRSSVVVGEKAHSSPGHVRAGGVLITLGPIVGDEGKVRVANSWWMNGLSGQWLTYVLGRQETGWEVTGISGPIAIS